MTMRTLTRYVIECDDCGCFADGGDPFVRRTFKTKAEAATFANDDDRYKSTPGGRDFCMGCWFRCGPCNGTGDDPGATTEPAMCKNCNGHGWVAEGLLAGGGDDD